MQMCIVLLVVLDFVVSSENCIKITRSFISLFLYPHSLFDKGQVESACHRHSLKVFVIRVMNCRVIILARLFLRLFFMFATQQLPGNLI